MIENSRKDKRRSDHHHCVSELLEIPDNTNVWIGSGTGLTHGQVISTGNTPISYIANTPTGTVQRNRAHLRVVPDPPERPATKEPTRRIMTSRQTGTVIRPSETKTVRADVA